MNISNTAKICFAIKTCLNRYKLNEMLYYFLVKPGNCFDIFGRGSTSSGIFTIYPLDGSDEEFLPIEVFSDMETFGGG